MKPLFKKVKTNTKDKNEPSVFICKMEFILGSDNYKQVFHLHHSQFCWILGLDHYKQAFHLHLKVPRVTGEIFVMLIWPH